MTASMHIASNLQRQPAIGYKAGVGFTNGEVAVTGNLSLYLGDTTFYNASLNNSYTSLTMVAGYSGSTNREALVFDVPHMKVVFESEISGKNQSRMVAGNYIADMHPTLGYVAGIGRFFYRPAVAVV